MMKGLGLNERAWKIADDLVARADELRLAVQTLPSGARVIDAGIDVRGGYGAGIGLAELCMGGLGHIRFAQLEIGGSAIPGVEVMADPDGVEAGRFGGATSGEVLLYGPDGHLTFAGGITSARGHEGDSPGAERIYDLVTTGHAELAVAPVFGCPLSAPAEGVRGP